MTDKRLESIETKIDKLQDRLSSIDSTLAAQHVSLEIHIKRTNLLEQRLEPVSDHVAMVHGALKLIGLIALLAGIAESIMVIIHG